MEKLPQLIMRNPDITVLPELILPEGMQLHTHIPGEEKNWEELIESAFGSHFDFDFLIRNGGYMPEYVQYIRYGGRDIATAAAVENPAYPHEGWFRMVGVRSNARGLGAGRLVCLAALHSLRRRGYRSAVLSTDDFRIPAICLYLSLGFRPLCCHESHRDRWKKVSEEIARIGKKTDFQAE